MKTKIPLRYHWISCYVYQALFLLCTQRAGKCDFLWPKFTLPLKLYSQHHRLAGRLGFRQADTCLEEYPHQTTQYPFKYFPRFTPLSSSFYYICSACSLYSYHPREKPIRSHDQASTSHPILVVSIEESPLRATRDSVTTLVFDGFHKTTIAYTSP